MPEQTHAETDAAIRAATTVDGALLATMQYMHEQQEARRELAGEEPTTADQMENDGAAQAWGEAWQLVSIARDRLRTLLVDLALVHGDGIRAEVGKLLA